MESSRSPHLASPAELKARIEAERIGDPFVVYRDQDGSQRIIPLPGSTQELTVGRDAGCDVPLAWDQHVSGLHAVLRRTGQHWLVIDDGLSRNGTMVNGERLSGHHRLRDADQLRLGETLLIFRHPQVPRTPTTALRRDQSPLELSPAQRRVLVALCRPFGTGSSFARAATNQEIAEQLYLTAAAVKMHLRALFLRFGVEDLPQNQKRIRLVQLAIDSGTVSPGELEGG